MRDNMSALWATIWLLWRSWRALLVNRSRPCFTYLVYCGHRTSRSTCRCVISSGWVFSSYMTIEFERDAEGEAFSLYVTFELEKEGSNMMPVWQQKLRFLRKMTRTSEKCHQLKFCSWMVNSLCSSSGNGCGTTLYTVLICHFGEDMTRGWTRMTCLRIIKKKTPPAFFRFRVGDLRSRKFFIHGY